MKIKIKEEQSEKKRGSEGRTEQNSGKTMREETLNSGHTTSDLTAFKLEDIASSLARTTPCANDFSTQGFYFPVETLRERRKKRLLCF